ncbi:2-polyprenyl-6-methoxyphenol hydroxylase-like FAD-dependent oxidoreductase [Allobranchiibius huperziae]|uniref:2-polyprenyl-6-methoxyphenol hydroxylase-like FAD-dependent oxidoreductase n=2 Tax=Allobranchiibius huperziae TaxID=1874116 RepID=A0A853D6R3_9MICO|nr:2-polyprenyl-6-methoxyphenol hydroxylase-like FAD-dependent oxidoreductase [Allobranchiibius huperziae]
MSYIDTYLEDVDVRHPETAAAVGAGSLYALEPGKGFLAHREADDRIHTYVNLDHPAEWFDQFDFTDPDATRAAIAGEFKEWSPVLRSLIADSDTDPILRAIYELPDEHRWDARHGVTLVGDAGHPTVPGGNGANNAMLDGAELGLAIAHNPDNVDAAIAAYEPIMFERAAKSATEAHQDVQMIFGPGSPHRLAAVFNGEEFDGA